MVPSLWPGARAQQGDAMPVKGGFYGNGVTAPLDYRVEIATG
jgi:hypothetical protein